MLPISSSFQRAFVATIWIVVVFAILICPFSVNASTEMIVDSHGNAEHSNLITHIVHLKEMSLKSVENRSLTSLILLVSLLLIYGAAFFANKNDYAVPGRLFAHARHYLVRKRDSLYLAKKEIYRWLSLFERAPNFIKAT